MSNRTEAVDEMAVIVMDQYAAACKLVFDNDGDFKGVPELYLKLLRPLYAEDYTLARLGDLSDLMARYTGPAVDTGKPKLSIAINLFTELQQQINEIAQSVARLTVPDFQWPDELNPKLTGIAPGSLYIGISIPSLSDLTEKQRESSKVTEQLYTSVQAAIQLLPIVPDYIDEEGLELSIEEKIPDRSTRNILLSAAINLAPTGQLGIDEVFLHGPIDKQVERAGPPKALTPYSRKILSNYLNQNQNRNLEDKKHHTLSTEPSAIQDKPELAASGYDAVKEAIVKKGIYQGVVRNIDLDDRRFELRQVEGLGTIQCRYTSELDNQALNILNANVMVEGKYEEIEYQQPGLVDVTKIEIIKPPNSNRF